MTLSRALALLLLASIHGCAASQPKPTSPEPASAATRAPVTARTGSEQLTYSDQGTEFKGYLAYPEGATDKRPGVLVVHEVWGLNDYARMRAQKLAELGYVALAIDMYGDGKGSEHVEEAMKFRAEAAANHAERTRRFAASLAALRADPRVDPSRIAAIGYCFGGGVVLGAARDGVDLKLVASFHGNYASETPLAKDAFHGKLFIAHGGSDAFTQPAQVEAFKHELDQAGARYEFVTYEGAKHGFTNPDATAIGQRNKLDIAYDAQADAASWSKLVELLAESFATP